MHDLVTPPKVLVYSTPDCGRCHAARQFFTARGLEVEMVNVSGDLGALRRMVRRSGGSRTVPVIEYGEEVITGFDPAFWQQRLGG